MPEFAIHEAVKPRLRLFLGVDLVGSTTYKQSPHEMVGEGASSPEPPAWLEPHLAFYTTFEQLLQQRWRQLQSIVHENDPASLQDQPQFWKANGDELLYTVEIQHEREPDLYLRLWVQTLRDYRDKVRAQVSNIPPLDVRSNAWLANFPMPNTEVIFRREVASADHPFIDVPALRQYHLRKVWYGDDASIAMEPPGQLSRDFIGPAIDTGFRISSWSTPRRLAISVELALVLMTDHYSEVHETDFPRLNIRVSGTDTLKGVLGGRPYPVAWVDVGSPTPPSAPARPSTEDMLWKAEDKIFYAPLEVKSEDQAEYLSAFIAHHKSFLANPVIEKSKNKLFRITSDQMTVLQEYQRALESRLAEYEKIKTAQS